MLSRRFDWKAKQQDWGEPSRLYHVKSPHCFIKLRVLQLGDLVAGVVSVGGQGAVRGGSVLAVVLPPTRLGGKTACLPIMDIRKLQLPPVIPFCPYSLLPQGMNPRPSPGQQCLYHVYGQFWCPAVPCYLIWTGRYHVCTWHPAAPSFSVDDCLLVIDYLMMTAWGGRGRGRGGGGIICCSHNQPTGNTSALGETWGGKKWPVIRELFVLALKIHTVNRDPN